MSYDNGHAALPKRRRFDALDPGGDTDGEKGLASLPRTLSRLRYCSVREALALIAQGRVTVDGLSARTVDQRVDPRRSRIAVDGHVLTAGRTVHLMIHKPRGLAVPRRNPEAQRTVHGCLPPGLPFLSPVGRLEKGSEGLLFMTNDAAWADRLLDPASGVTSRYHVQIDRTADAALIAALAAPCGEGRDAMRAVSVRPLDPRPGQPWIEIVLADGCDRLIRRSVAARRATVRRLVRVAIGDIPLGDLEPGRSRLLSAAEVERLVPPGGAMWH